MSEKIVLTGIKPTGMPHLGNCVGALKPLIEQSKTQKTFMFIADSKLPEDKKDPDESTIYQLYKHFATDAEIAEFAEMFRRGAMGYGTAKTILFEKINSVLAEPRAKYEYLMSNTAEIDAILADGTKRAGAVARETLARVKKAMLG